MKSNHVIFAAIFGAMSSVCTSIATASPTVAPIPQFEVQLPITIKMPLTHDPVVRFSGLPVNNRGPVIGGSGLRFPDHVVYQANPVEFSPRSSVAQRGNFVMTGLSPQDANSVVVSMQPAEAMIFRSR